MAKFAWKAIYEDCLLKQNWETGEGNSFGEVEQKGLPQKFFVGSKFGVNLQTGELLIKGKWQQFSNNLGEPLKPTRLIYFRRVHQWKELGTDRGGSDIRHFVGFEFDDGWISLCIPNVKSRYSICVGGLNEQAEHKS